MGTDTTVTCVWLPWEHPQVVSDTRVYLQKVLVDCTLIAGSKRNNRESCSGAKTFHRLIVSRDGL